MTTGEAKGTFSTEPRVGVAVRLEKFGPRGLPGFSYLSWEHWYPALGVLDGRALTHLVGGKWGDSKASYNMSLGVPEISCARLTQGQDQKGYARKRSGGCV